MNLDDNIESALERVSEEMAKPSRPYDQRPVYVGQDEVTIKREDLTILISAATWRLGYLQGRKG